MVKITNIVVSLVVFILFSACSSTPDQKYETSNLNSSGVKWTQDGLPAPKISTRPTLNDEVIRPLDTLNITVFDVKKLGGEYQVGLDGNLKVPLIGEVKAEGFTPYEFSAYLEERYGDKYLQNPQVIVRLEASEEERITVDGSVKSPGLYPIRGETTLLHAIALSGGPGEDANLDKVVVFRNIDGVRQAAGFNVKQIRKGMAEDPKLYGNDIVVVEGHDTKKAYRELLRAVPLLLFLAL